MNLVLSGGGIKGLCYLSVIKYFEKNNLTQKFKNFAGTSIGALFCLLIILKYKYKELENILLGNVIEKIYNIDIFKFMENYSICDSKLFRNILEILIQTKFKKKNITLLELYNNTNKNINIILTNITNGSETILNKDNNPNLDIIDCIIAACSIPGLYEPFKINNNYYLDGFLVNNYPIDIFKDDLENTIGIKITESNYYETMNFKNYIHNLFLILTKNKKKFNENYYNKLKKNIYLENKIGNFDINILKSKIKSQLNHTYNILEKEMNNL